jgi:hypothetical protein
MPTQQYDKKMSLKSLTKQPSVAYRDLLWTIASQHTIKDELNELEKGRILRIVLIRTADGNTYG